MNEHRKVANRLAEELKGQMPEKQRKALKSLHRRADKWARMEEGDEVALMELSCELGLCSKEAFDEYFKIKNILEHD